jgi:hypothetical protein
MLGKGIDLIQTPHTVSMDWVINRFLQEFGISVNKIDLTPEEMAKIIAQYTIPEFSKYFPNEQYIELNEHNKADQVGFYYLNCAEPVISVSRVIGGFRNSSGELYDSTYGFRRTFSGLTMDITTAMNAADVAAITSIPITTRFHAPNIVELYPKNWYHRHSVLVNCMHPVDLHTISWRMSDYFYQLAKCDLMIQLKGLYLRFNRINSIYGEIEMNLEEWNNAEDKRKELIELFRTNSLKRSNRTKWIIG